MKVNAKVAVNALLYTRATERKQAKTEPLYHPPHRLVIGRNMANILLVGQHWLPITSLDRLLGDRLTNSAFCYRCLRNLYHADRLEKHMAKCYNSKGQMTVMPKPEDAVKKF